MGGEIERQKEEMDEKFVIKKRKMRKLEEN
jgi:hypothetical protein